MSARVRRGLLGAVALGALVLAACGPVAAPAPTPTPTPTPPPPPAANALCESAPAPDASDHVAVVKDDDGTTDVVTFEASSALEVQQEVAELEKTGDVVTVEQDRTVQALSVNPGDDPEYAQQYGFTTAFGDYAPAWILGFDGTNVRVAVVDTGVQANHADLGPAQVVQGKDFVVSDAASDFGRVDGNGHGTHVAGTIVAADNTIGVVGGAPKAHVVPVRVLNCAGAGTYSDVANGVLWASDQTASGGQAKVINLSLGGSSPSSTLQAALQTAVSRGVVVVAAAGNGGAGGAALYPAAYPEAIAVGAVDSLGNIAPYSNTDAYIDVAAAGTLVHSTLNTLGYGDKSGTSMATPHIAAIAALLKQKCPLYTPAQVLARLTATAGSALPGFVGTVGIAKAGAATAAVC